MNEQYLQKKITKYLEEKGCYVVKVITANKSGVPDILFCMDGKFNAIEVKAPGKLYNLSKLQAHHINLINSTGGVAIVADSMELVKQKFP